MTKEQLQNKVLQVAENNSNASTLLLESGIETKEQTILMLNDMLEDGATTGFGNGKIEDVENTLAKVRNLDCDSNDLISIDDIDNPYILDIEEIKDLLNELKEQPR